MMGVFCDNNHLLLRKYLYTDAVEILQNRPRQPGVELNDMVRRWTKTKELTGPAITGVYDGRIVGCGGLEILWPGFAEVWCLFVSDIGKHACTLMRVGRIILKDWVKNYSLIRIQTPLRADFGPGIRFAKAFGFEYEATLHKYHPDETDAEMYTIIKLENSKCHLPQP